jgi:hypothetical protein
MVKNETKKRGKEEREKAEMHRGGSFGDGVLPL